MMTMVRVLPDKDYDEIMRQKKNAVPAGDNQHHKPFLSGKCQYSLLQTWPMREESQ